MPHFHLLLLLLTTLLTTAFAATCTAPSLPSYTKCTSLPSLSSTLHHTYTSSNHTLSIAFTATPPSPSGWVGFGINPVSTGMEGSQALVAFKNPKDSSLSVSTFNLSSYTSISPAPLSFHVYEKRAVFNSGDGSITIFAAVKSDGGKVNFVWQVGPGVTKGFPMKHDFKAENLQSKLTLDVASSSGNATAGGGGGASADSSGGVELKMGNVGCFVSFGLALFFYIFLEL